MSKKDKLRILLIILMLLATLPLKLWPMPTDAAKLEVTATSESSDKERLNKYVWYYKEENGKKYRRLYDETDGVWITDWILCE